MICAASPGDQSEEYRGLVQIPEEEELSTAGCGASNMTKQVDGWVPESFVKAQDNLTRRSAIYQ